MSLRSREPFDTAITRWARAIALSPSLSEDEKVVALAGLAVADRQHYEKTGELIFDEADVRRYMSETV